MLNALGILSFFDDVAVKTVSIHEQIQSLHWRSELELHRYDGRGINALKPVRSI